ncbi:MAG: putative dehydrogenase [Arenicella sp.]|jgi:predicted dehydrogenase
MINVGIIGYGFASKTFHAPLISACPDMRLTAIMSSQREAINTDYPDVIACRVIGELIAHVDLVVIATPNDVHYSLAKYCLEQRMHVVVDKPMTTTYAEAQSLIKLSEDYNVEFSIFHNRRWDGDFLTVKKLLDTKALGKLRIFESHFDRFRPRVRERWREQPGAGSGIWFDLGSHLIDQALHLFGTPSAITARCLELREHSQVIDYFHVLLHYNHLEVILHSSPFSASTNTRYHLQGDLASFIKPGLDIQESQLIEGSSPLDQMYGHDLPEQYGILYRDGSSEKITTETGRYQHYYQSVADAINYNRLLPVTAQEAAVVIKVIELGIQSSQQGVTLEFGQ